MNFSNYHTHTRLCDGRDTPEELVQEALRLGCPELGFSGHAHMPFDDGCAMSREATETYIREIGALRERYRDRIRIRLGIEQDYYSDLSTAPYDYVIGSVHYIVKDGVYLSVDESREKQIAAVRDHYAGDWYAFVEDYYALVGQVYEKTGCRIVGHFDLVTKFNEDGALFDTGNPHYQEAARRAMEKLLEKPVLFEINTGAMARGYRRSPCPEEWLLRELERRGAGFILSSDCHDRRYLLYGLEELRSCVKGIRDTPF